ncbi:DinB family protein [Paenibacillus sp. P25]|nr:DinB family protein [Paenibacillus sp. P25]
MSQTEQLMAELKREAELTRSVLKRVPPDKLSWKPHAKSMSLGQLALHTAGVPGFVAEPLHEPIREVPVVPLPEAASVSEILSVLDEQLAVAENRLLAWGEAGLAETWKLTREGVPILQMPRFDMVRTILFNHWYHHRGQLTVYLRLLDVPVPSVYGPSADEW